MGFIVSKGLGIGVVVDWANGYSWVSPCVDNEDTVGCSCNSILSGVFGDFFFVSELALLGREMTHDLNIKSED